VEKRPLHRRVDKAVVAVTGSAVVGIGVVLLPLPGPGVAIIAAGLVILGKEFPAARRTLDRAIGALRRVTGPFPILRRWWDEDVEPRPTESGPGTRGSGRTRRRRPGSG